MSPFDTPQCLPPIPEVQENTGSSHHGRSDKRLNYFKKEHSSSAEGLLTQPEPTKQGITRMTDTAIIKNLSARKNKLQSPVNFGNTYTENYSDNKQAKMDLQTSLHRSAPPSSGPSPSSRRPPSFSSRLQSQTPNNSFPMVRILENILNGFH